MTILRAQSSLGHFLWCSEVAATPRTAGRLGRKGAEPARKEKPRELYREGSSFQVLPLGQWYEKSGATSQGGWSEGKTEWHKLNMIQHYNTWGEFIGEAHKTKTVNG